MPRRSRIAFAYCPHHIVQRGHCHKDVFLCDFDRIDYLATLAECREALQLKLFAYYLMSNHVHLVVDPGENAMNLGRRRLRYRELVRETIDDRDLALIRGAARRNQLTGTSDFVANVNRDQGLSKSETGALRRLYAGKIDLSPF